MQDLVSSTVHDPCQACVFQQQPSSCTWPSDSTNTWSATLAIWSWCVIARIAGFLDAVARKPSSSTGTAGGSRGDRYKWSYISYIVLINGRKYMGNCAEIYNPTSRGWKTHLVPLNTDMFHMFQVKTSRSESRGVHRGSIMLAKITRNNILFWVERGWMYITAWKYTWVWRQLHHLSSISPWNKNIWSIPSTAYPIAKRVKVWPAAKWDQPTAIGSFSHE